MSPAAASAVRPEDLALHGCRARARFNCPASTVGNPLGAAALWLVELVALPRSGATPPLRAWPRGDAVLDATNALAFSAE